VKIRSLNHPAGIHRRSYLLTVLLLSLLVSPIYSARLLNICSDGATGIVTNATADLKPEFFHQEHSGATPGESTQPSQPPLSEAMTAATFTVTNTSDAGPGSLRQAILDANGNTGTDLIQFQIGSGAQVIFPLSSLPIITDPVVIDATTQPGYSGTPIIELNGTNAGGADGITITAGSTTIRGFVINSFNTGIKIDLKGENRIEGNYIGTDLSGNLAKPNAGAGVSIGNSNLNDGGQNFNIIGGTTPATRNVISGNMGDGILLMGNLHQGGSFGHSFVGNYIGLTASGNTQLGNGGNGITISPSTNASITKNVISGNIGYGIFGIGSNLSAIIEDNHIGTDATGTFAIGNTSGGINVGTTRTGNFAINNNLVSGNKGVGIRAGTDSMTSCAMQNNRVGTNGAGTAPLGNLGNGIELNSGGTSSITGNTVSANKGNGVVLNSQGGGSIANNLIGGTDALGNNMNGIVVSGQTASVTGNTIAFNKGNGVLTNSSPFNNGQTILTNSISSNGGLGIDLYDDSISPNFNCGGGGVTNYPLLTSATSSGGSTSIQGTFNSSPGQSFTLQFFASPSCDASGHGEGETFIGAATITTTSSCIANFNVSVPVAVAAGQVITATATNPSNWSSEFSQCVIVNAPPISTVQFDSATYSVNEGAGFATITVTRANGAGPATINYATANGTATAGSDYTATSGTLSFAANEMSKTFNVPITDDTTIESNETITLNLSSPSGVTLGNPNTAVLTVVDNDSAVQFSQTSYTVSEGAGFATINVTRTGDTSTAATVKYSTSDTTDVNFQCDPSTPNQGIGAASRKCDYHIAVGRLRFAPGETTRPIILSIVNDIYVETPENFTITLSNPTGTALAIPNIATITIIDNDTGSAANPIDGTAFYVRQLYVDLLSREPDPAGQQGWINRIDLCGQPGQPPPPCDRVTVGGDGFLRSAEFFDRQLFVIRLYRAGLGRIPRYEDVGDLAYVSGFLTDADLELNKQELVAEIMSRSEFSNIYNGLNNNAYVNTLIATSAVTIPQSVRDGWVTALNNSSKSRAQVYRELSERTEVNNRYLHEAQVVSCYYGFFTRNPDVAYLNFLSRLDSGQINLSDLANAFINAAEYRQRFGF
jgi:hypothetical protein